MLRFAEEILLLLLDEARGEIAPNFSPHSLNIVLAGAVLMDLALENRIDTDLEQLTLVDATPLEDDLLDPILADIARTPGIHPPPPLDCADGRPGRCNPGEGGCAPRRARHFRVGFRG